MKMLHKNNIHMFFMLVCMVVILYVVVGCAPITDIEADLQFAKRCMELKLWKEAVFRYELLIQKDPSNPVFHNNLAIVYEALGEIEKAKKEYETALQLDPNNKYVRKNLESLLNQHDMKPGNQNEE